MLFTIEFFRLREEDDAHATLDRITHIGTDLEAVKVKAKSLFETLNMPQKPAGSVGFGRWRGSNVTPNRKFVENLDAVPALNAVERVVRLGNSPR